MHILTQFGQVGVLVDPDGVRRAHGDARAALRIQQIGMDHAGLELPEPHLARRVQGMPFISTRMR